ncbi:MAG: V-type ATPase 116kDa subunit family protein [bacterium]|nr:V-type ATPase 116kDa subunit family protein [bacterium]
MIEKMQFINITGPKTDIDRVVNTYLSKYEIHLENALTELSGVTDLSPFIETNPYKDVLGKAGDLIKKVPDDATPGGNSMSVEEAMQVITTMTTELDKFNNEKRTLKNERNHMRELLQKIEPFRLLNYDLRKILHFRFIKFRFGRISHEYFDKFSKYIYDNLNTVFYECFNDKDYIWGVYFVPDSSKDEVDAIYSSLHFERIFLSDEYEGTPEESYQKMNTSLDTILDEIKEIYKKINEYISTHSGELLDAYNILNTHSKNFDIRKMAAITNKNSENATFYILCGWMSADDCKQFIKEISNDSLVFVITDASVTQGTMKPPTKLKNFSLLRPFELFVKMYGLPAYNEFDPTLLVALTYSFLFGAMFGDVGQGLCLVIGGFLLYRKKHMDIAGIISVAGIFSVIFGFAYGSFFGFENVIKGFWMKPMDNVMSILIISVCLGVVMILVAIILNIINSIRQKDYDRLLFDQNGIAGLIFYGGGIACVATVALGHVLPATIIIAIILGIPLVTMFFKEPLTKLIEHKKQDFPEGKAMFVIEAIVELFDILLSYATNTVSYLRVGAFALSHAGMMSVVLLLAGAEGGSPNWIVIIIGNIIVAGMEGLVVGIQVLRLEYYEIFGRFYRGTGKEFKSFQQSK